jgi:hypothetical protein
MCYILIAENLAIVLSWHLGDSHMGTSKAAKGGHPPRGAKRQKGDMA